MSDSLHSKYIHACHKEQMGFEDYIEATIIENVCDIIRRIPNEEFYKLSTFSGDGLNPIKEMIIKKICKNL